MSLGVSPDITTSGSDGSTDLYASPSGMVGAEINGVWIMALPPERTVYRTNYAGTNVVIARYGDRYSITMPGVAVADRLRRYNPRFLTGQYFDARGNAHASPATVQAGGDPDPIYFEVGPAANSGGVGTANEQTIIGTTEAGDIVSTVTPGTPDNQNATIPPASQSWTRSSDGRTDVFISDSGMVGGIVRTVNGADVWALWMPTANVTYESHYQNGTIKGMNYGDGTYQLEADGINARRRYASKWVPGAFYDSNGNRITSAAAAQVARDPGPAFFTPGAIVSQAIMETPLPPATPPGTPPTGPIQPVTPTSGGSGGTFTPGPEIIAAEFPDTVQEPTSAGLSPGALLALGVAAFTLFN